MTTIQTHRFPTSLSRTGRSRAAGENRIGGHQKSVIPVRNSTTKGLFPTAGTKKPQGLLLMKHAFTQRYQNFSGHFAWHCSVHPTGATVTVELCSSGLASKRSTISRYGVVARARMRLHHSLELRSMRRCNRAIRSWKERSGSSTTLIGLAVHEYTLTCVHLHSILINEFHNWCSCRTTRTRTTSRIRALGPDIVCAR